MGLTLYHSTMIKRIYRLGEDSNSGAHALGHRLFLPFIMLLLVRLLFLHYSYLPPLFLVVCYFILLCCPFLSQPSFYACPFFAFMVLSVFSVSSFPLLFTSIALSYLISFFSLRCPFVFLSTLLSSLVFLSPTLFSFNSFLYYSLHLFTPVSSFISQRYRSLFFVPFLYLFSPFFFLPSFSFPLPFAFLPPPPLLSTFSPSFRSCLLFHLCSCLVSLFSFLSPLSPRLCPF